MYIKEHIHIVYFHGTIVYIHFLLLFWYISYLLTFACYSVFLCFLAYIGLWLKPFLFFFTTLFSFLFDVRAFFFFLHKTNFYKRCLHWKPCRFEIEFAFQWMFKSIKITQITTKRYFCRLYKYTYACTHTYTCLHIFNEL